jgi:hypothetical protein
MLCKVSHVVECCPFLAKQIYPRDGLSQFCCAFLLLAVTPHHYLVIVFVTGVKHNLVLQVTLALTLRKTLQFAYTMDLCAP